MKILHVIPFGIFAINYVNAFNECDMDNHRFWLYGYSKKAEIERNIRFANDKNVMRITETEYYSFEKEYHNHDIILFLYIPEDLKLLNLICECYKKTPKPYILSPWGRDANRTSDIYQMNESTWLPIDKMKAWLVKNSCCIASTQRIYDVLEKLYNVKSPRLFFSNNLLAFNTGNLLDLDEIKSCEKLRILVGHRGTKTCRHIEIFDMIMPYKRKIGCIICPLSYGEKDYIKKIRRIGKMRFWNKWKPILEWIDVYNYMRFLNENVDVAIFNSQFEGASTIYALAYMGKTIYLNENCETAEILDEIGIVYYKLDVEHGEIVLKTLSEIERKNNRKKMKEYGSVNRFYEKWMFLINECFKNWENSGRSRDKEVLIDG